MNLTESYFSISNPFDILDRWLNPYRHQASIVLRNKTLSLQWTKRAQAKLDSMSSPLAIEMQLYFTCVVKKRVLFHEHDIDGSLAANKDIQVYFRTVQSESCDPVEFAQNFPVKREMDSLSATKMAPSRLTFDYKNGSWSGDYSV